MPRAKNYTIGAGKLFFDRFDENDLPTGEYYIGNTTALTGGNEEEREEHYSSDEAERAKDASVVTSSDLTIGFTTDDIQPENLAMLWKGSVEQLAVVAAASLTQDLKVRRGRWYQLGQDAAHPTGRRQLTLTTLTDDTPVTPVAVPGGAGGVNYDFDPVLGRLFIKEDATGIADGDILKVTYAQVAHSRTVIISQGETIRGSLRYVADNTYGVNRDDYWPLVELSPDGDYEFKGDSWSEMSFTGEVLKREGYSKHYVDGRPVTA